MERAAKVKLFLLFAAVAVPAAIFLKVYLKAASPSSVKVTVYKIELMTGASDTNPQVVFSSDDSGSEIDLTKDTVVGQAQLPVGTYKRIRMTVANGVKQSILNEDDNPCGGDAFTDLAFSIADGTAPDSRVQINFATHDDAGGTWTDSRITHVLLGPVTVSENKATQVKFMFNAANTLFCSGGAVKMRSPWAVWTETPIDSL